MFNAMQSPKYSFSSLLSSASMSGHLQWNVVVESQFDDRFSQRLRPLLASPVNENSPQ